MRRDRHAGQASMTEPQRRTLRQLIDRARRERLQHDKNRARLDALDWAAAGEERICAYCGQMFLLDGCAPNRAKRRFCTTTHRANFHRRERLRREREWVATLKAKATLA